MRVMVSPPPPRNAKKGDRLLVSGYPSSRHLGRLNQASRVMLVCVVTTEEGTGVEDVTTEQRLSA